MNKIYANELEQFKKNKDSVKNCTVGNGNLRERLCKLDSFLEMQEEADREQDGKLKAAVDQYAKNYRKRNSEKYPEQRLFFDVKRHMEQDALFHLVKEMPKGGLLHVHSVAGLSFERLILLCKRWNEEKVRNRQWEYVIKVNIRESTEKLAKYTLMYRYQEKRLQESGILAECVSLDNFLNVEGNTEKLKEALCIVDEIKDSAEVWRQFQRKYSRFTMLFKNGEFYKDYHKAFFEECRDDKISFVQIRCGFEEFENARAVGDGLAEYHEEHILRAAHAFSIDNYLYHKDMLLGASDGEVTEKSVEFLKKINEAAKEVLVKDSEGAEKPMTVKVILTSNRGLNPEQEEEGKKLRAKVDLAINIRNATEEYKEIAAMVIGFDFVNHEEKGFSTEAYLPVIYEKTADPEGVLLERIKQIPFYLHDGEADWKEAPGIRWGSGSEKVPNIVAGSICSKYRIGHGLAAAVYPEMINGLCYGLKENESDDSGTVTFPVLEINPISNQLLKYTPDLRKHPVYQFMKQGLNCVLGNDDPLLLDNPGLSYDVWLLMADAEVDYATVKKMIFLSYVFYYLDAGDKELDMEDYALEEAGKWFRKEWKEFLESAGTERFIRENG